MSKFAEKTFIPEGYHSDLDVRETEKAIKEIKDYFQLALAEKLNLQRVSAPLFVDKYSGLNDNLNGVERPVGFDIGEEEGKSYEIVQSLAKWKRLALKRYGFNAGEGLYTDMNAIRRDEETDNLHSVYVDQWDWEKVIERKDRTIETLKDTVEKIYTVMKSTEYYMLMKYGFNDEVLLNPELTFVTTQELEDEYPDLEPSQREDAFVRKHGSAFIMKIGGALKSGQIHDGRAPDYDDWELNGDLVVYNPVLDIAFEISSMGIRVDAESMKKQLEIRGCQERAELDFHRMVLNDELPLTMGGGIGQSRLCMFFLRKAHIGEVQASVWTEDTRAKCAEKGVELL